MAVLEKLFRAARVWRGSLTHPSNSGARALRRCLYHGTFEQSNSKVSQVLRSCTTINDSPSFSMGPAFLCALFGVGAIGVVYAESDEANVKPSLPIDPPPNYLDIAKKERARIEELIQSKGTRHASYPLFNVAVRGQKITLKFQVPSTCEVAQLIANIGSQLGVKVSDRTGGSDMLLRAWDSPVAWQITLRSVENKKEAGGNEDDADEDLCILIFGSLITSDKVEVEFIKKGNLTSEELEAFVSVLQVAGTKAAQNKGGGGRSSTREPSTENLYFNWKRWE